MTFRANGALLQRAGDDSDTPPDVAISEQTSFSVTSTETG